MLVSANGIEINYTEAGEGEPLILIMGLGADGSRWAPHVKAYQKYFRCIMVDNRGAGLSSVPELPAYTTEQMADDIAALMDAIGIGSAHFHGISMGGAVAQIMGIKYPEKVRSLILTSTFARAGHVFTRAIEILRDTKGIVGERTFTHLLDWMIWSETYHEQQYDRLNAGEEEGLAAGGGMSTAAFRAQCNACITHDVLKDLGRIKAPVLIAAGEKDLLAPLYSTQELVDGIPQAELYVCPDSGHVHHWEAEAEFNRVTLEFLLKHRQK